VVVRDTYRRDTYRRNDNHSTHNTPKGMEQRWMDRWRVERCRKRRRGRQAQEERVCVCVRGSNARHIVSHSNREKARDANRQGER